MQRVRGKGNRTTEVRFRGALVGAGISGWKLNCRTTEGHPDFFFAKGAIAVFLDGCFWHGCEMCGHVPKTNAEFWKFKISRNRDRDARNTALLQRRGVTVIRFWEHDVRNSLHQCVEKIRSVLLRPRKRRSVRR